MEFALRHGAVLSTRDQPDLFALRTNKNLNVPAAVEATVISGA